MRIKKINSSMRLPCALTIAGSDSGGGAGIQADLKTFASLGVHGASAITCVTAQNPAEVRGVEALSPKCVRDQIEAVIQAFHPEAVKTGMLYSARIIQTVEETIPRDIPLVIDPVMISTSGTVLLRNDAIAALKRFLARASLITPNLHEAEHLLNRKITDPETLRAAAREFHERYGCAALLKGGHLPATRSAIDFFYDGHTELLLEAPFVRAVSTHGTGCTYSAAITAHCALGLKLPHAVAASKEFITNAIAHSYRVADHSALNSFWAA